MTPPLTFTPNRVSSYSETPKSAASTQGTRPGAESNPMPRVGGSPSGPEMVRRWNLNHGVKLDFSPSSLPPNSPLPPLPPITGFQLMGSVGAMREWVNGPDLKSATILADLRELTQAVLNAKADDFDLKSLGQSGVAGIIFDEIAALRRELTFRVTTLEGGFTESVDRALRHADLVLDSFSRQLLLSVPRTKNYVEKPPEIAHQIPVPMRWAMDPKHQKLEDMPDVFFITADGATSKNGYDVPNSIRRSTAFDSPVSHAAMVVRLKKGEVINGKTLTKDEFWIAESTSAHGLNVHPLNDEDYKWFRTSAHVDFLVANDPALQKAYDAAGKQRFWEAQEQLASGKSSAYRFDMRDVFVPSPIGDTELMCLGFVNSIYDLPIFYEVAQANGYPKEKLASLLPKNADGLRRPGFPNRLDLGEGTRQLVRRWGIEPDSANAKLASPGDLLVNPLLKKVGSGDTTENVVENMEMTAVYRSIFGLMNEKGYNLRPEIINRPFAAAAIGIRNIPIVGDEFLGNMMPADMPLGALASILDLRMVGNAIWAELHQKNEAFIKKNGRSMTLVPEMADALEEVRREDEERYYRWLTRKAERPELQPVDVPKFHWHFQPMVEPRFRWYDELGAHLNASGPKSFQEYYQSKKSVAR